MVISIIQAAEWTAAVTRPRLESTQTEWEASLPSEQDLPQDKLLIQPHCSGDVWESDMWERTRRDASAALDCWYIIHQRNITFTQPRPGGFQYWVVVTEVSGWIHNSVMGGSRQNCAQNSFSVLKYKSANALFQFLSNTLLDLTVLSFTNWLHSLMNTAWLTSIRILPMGMSHIQIL